MTDFHIDEFCILNMYINCLLHDSISLLAETIQIKTNNKHILPCPPERDANTARSGSVRMPYFWRTDPLQAA